jgi:hypothetical protein
MRETYINFCCKHDSAGMTLLCLFQEVLNYPLSKCLGKLSAATLCSDTLLQSSCLPWEFTEPCHTANSLTENVLVTGVAGYSSCRLLLSMMQECDVSYWGGMQEFRITKK